MATTTSLRSANYRIDFTKMTLIMTTEFAEKAYNPATEEYETLKRLKKDFPDLKISKRTHRTPAKYVNKQGEEFKHNQFKDLTYNRMEKFMSSIPNHEIYEAEYKFIKDFATNTKGNGYPLVRKWFLIQFPLFHSNPMFYLYNSPALVDAGQVMSDPASDMEQIAC